MGDRETRNPNQPQTTSRLGLRNSGGGGEIVEVQGGHIVRSTGRKDRHSKVCTAKGPRDRRVRLSAHTAIQFYDVQDRLGYDRPSKAVDWLIKKAKSAIDELAELPPWHPTTTTITNTTSNAANVRSNEEEQQQILQGHVVDIMGGSSSGSRRGTLFMSGDKGNVYSMQYPQDRVEGGQGNVNAGNAAFLPASLDSDSIADTIKSFFPVGGASAEANSGFQNYPPDLLSRTSSNNQNNINQDLRLSLQSLQDPMLMQSHQQHQHHSGPTHQAIFSGNNSVGFDGVASTTGWSDHASVDFGRMQRMIAWNAGRDSSASGGNGGFMFNPLSPQPLSQPSLQPLFGQSGQFYSQRGPLQSSNTPTIRAWIDQPIPDHTQHHHQTPSIHHPYEISSIGGSSASGGFSGFRVPMRVQGEEEERDGISNKPSSASSDSRH